MRRLVSLSFVLAMLIVLVPTAGASTNTRLDVAIAKAPITPDGVAARAITDLVLTFVDIDPAVDGISLHTGATVTATLPRGFVDTHDGSVNSAILLQGWPQSPPAPFPWTTSVSGNSITATLTGDYLVGDFGPGPKQMHLLLNSFRNPHAGAYRIDLVIQPDPSSPDIFTGTGRVRITPDAEPSINIVSVFSGGGPPPPFNNPIYQTVLAGDTSLDVGLHLWDEGSSVVDGIFNAFVGVEVQMVSPSRGRLVQGTTTVGGVRIDAPAGADEFTLGTDGPSILAPGAVLGFDTGTMIARLHTDPDVTGQYTVTLRLNGGNTQQFFVTAN
jgi:hypothetical protein